MKFGLKHYFAPTPKRLRVLGDSLVVAGTAVGSMCSLQGDTRLGTAILVLGVIGKFLSNFFAQEDPQSQTLARFVSEKRSRTKKQQDSNNV